MWFAECKTPPREYSKPSTTLHQHYVGAHTTKLFYSLICSPHTSTAYTYGIGPDLEWMSGEWQGGLSDVGQIE